MTLIIKDYLSNDGNDDNYNIIMINTMIIIMIPIKIYLIVALKYLLKI